MGYKKNIIYLIQDWIDCCEFLVTTIIINIFF